MIDDGVGIPFELSSAVLNPNIMGVQMKATERFFLGYVAIKYNSTDDFTLRLRYTRGDNDSEINELSYPVSKDENFFKQKLPPDIMVTNYVLSAIGVCTGYIKIPAFHVLWDVSKVGMG